MVIKVHNVFVVQCFVKLDFSVNLAEGKSSKENKGQKLQLNANGWQLCAQAQGAARLPSPVGEVWRRARVG